MTKRMVDEGFLNWVDKAKKLLGRDGPAPEKAKFDPDDMDKAAELLEKAKKNGNFNASWERHFTVGDARVTYSTAAKWHEKGNWNWKAHRSDRQFKDGTAHTAREAIAAAWSFLNQKLEIPQIGNPGGPPRKSGYSIDATSTLEKPPTADDAKWKEALKRVQDKYGTPKSEPETPRPVVTSKVPSTQTSYEPPKPVNPSTPSRHDPESNAAFPDAGVSTEAPNGTALSFITHHLRKDARGIMLLSDLHDKYKAVAAKHGAPVIDLTQFASRLSAVGFKVEQSGPGHIVRGVKYLPYINPNRTDAEMNKALDDHRAKWKNINDKLPNQGLGKDGKGNTVKEDRELNEYQIRRDNAAKDSQASKAARNRGTAQYDAWHEKLGAKYKEASKGVRSQRKNIDIFQKTMKSMNKGGHIAHGQHAYNQAKAIDDRRLRRINRWKAKRKKRIAEALTVLLRRGDAVMFKEMIVSELYRRAKNEIEAARVVIAAPLMVSEEAINRAMNEISHHYIRRAVHRSKYNEKERMASTAVQEGAIGNMVKSGASKFSNWRGNVNFRKGRIADKNENHGDAKQYRNNAFAWKKRARDWSPKLKEAFDKAFKEKGKYGYAYDDRYEGNSKPAEMSPEEINKIRARRKQRGFKGDRVWPWGTDPHAAAKKKKK